MTLSRLDPQAWIKNYSKTALININSGISIEYYKDNSEKYECFQFKTNHSNCYCRLFKNKESIPGYLMPNPRTCFDEEYFEYLKRIFENDWDYNDINIF